MLSKAVERYIAKKVSKLGKKGAIIWVIGKIVKATPTKKDDAMFEAIKEILKKF
jgi:hypothetical protein